MYRGALMHLGNLKTEPIREYLPLSINQSFYYYYFVNLNFTILAGLANG